MVTNNKLPEMNIRSYAKINLFLDVLAKRSDGFHDIRTIFSEISLFDTLNFTLTKNGETQILTNKHFVSVENNLIYKVMIFIKEKYNVLKGVRIFLEKRIPLSAGLGGGSSNAAATIKALSKLWDLNLTREEMHKIAANFGSDINFFIEGGCALGEGRGEKITLLNDIELDNIVLVKPPFGVSSSEAYNSVQLSNQNLKWKDLLNTSKVDFCYNKLEEGVCRIYPEINEMIDFLENNGADKAILSGSGSTVIGFCSDPETAKNISEYYSKKKYWNFITKTKGRSTK